METKHAQSEAKSSAAKVRSPMFPVKPLSPALGAEIIGVDLSEDNDDHIFAQIRDIWHQNLVILLRDQRLSEEDEVRFAEKFGPPAVIHAVTSSIASWSLTCPSQIGRAPPARPAALGPMTTTLERSHTSRQSDWRSRAPGGSASRSRAS